MKITNAERARLVEILRCAAWLVIQGETLNPTIRAMLAIGVNVNDEIYDLVYAVRDEVQIELPRLATEYQLLEAAARMEEGWTP